MRRLARISTPLLLLIVSQSIAVEASVAASKGNTLLCAFSRTPLTELERKIGRKFAAHRIYHKWDSNFPGRREQDDVAAGRVPFLTWKATRRGTPVSWKRIASGGEDALIRSRATGLKNFGKAVLLSFHHEPENDVGKNGTPADYVAAFRRVSSIFDSAGATNVKMVWGPIMAYTFQGGHGGPDHWYPGPSYVDYIGTDGYNWYPGRPSTKWRSFRDTFNEAYEWAVAHGKPLAIAEVGVMEDPKVPGRKAEWLEEALTTMKSWPALKTFCYFNSNGPNDNPWWITSSPGALAAFKRLAHDPWMGGTGVSVGGGRSSETTNRVSMGSNEKAGNRDSRSPAVDADGGGVAFESASSNLVADDTNAAADVFVRVRNKGVTWRVSVSSDGRQANGDSGEPSISADGRFVAFSSGATNLVAGDTNTARDVFLRDRRTRRTIRVSAGSRGRQPNGSSGEPAVSADGHFVAFSSDASNLIDEDTNRARDVFVWERATGRVVRVSVTSKKGQGNGKSHAPSVSSDGSLVAFESEASNLNEAGDTNGAADVFVRDRDRRKTVRISVTSRKREANAASRAPSISADGRFVAFESEASNLNEAGDTNRAADVFVRDRDRSKTILVSVTRRKAQANGRSTEPQLSAKGNRVAFTSVATNLSQAGDTNKASDVFVRDRAAGTTKRVSVSWSGKQASGASWEPAISRDGRFVAFSSAATNLNSKGDQNDAVDVFLRGPLA